MFRANTHIHVILDRSGSMAAIRDDAIGGFNTFLREQQDLGLDATLTLVQFDSQDPYDVVCDFMPLAEVRPLDHKTFVPRAGTPLLDAVGRGIRDLDRRLASLPRALRPEKVVFAMITDGQENASHEFRRGEIQRLLRDRRERQDWQLVYVTASLEAFDEAGQLGVPMAARMSFTATPGGTQAAFRSLSHSIAAYRRVSGSKVEFGDEDRAEQERLRRGGDGN